MNEQQAKMIMAFAKSNMILRQAAKKVFVNECTLSYHLQRIHEQTGKNPREFFDLCYLVGLASKKLEGKHE